MNNIDEVIARFSEYIIEDGDTTLIEPCFCITLFSSANVTQEHVPDGFLTPYRVFWEDFGHQVDRILYDGNQSHGVKVNEKNLRIPYDWLENPKKRARQSIFIDAYASTNKKEIRLPRLEWMYETADAEIDEPCQYFYRIYLPVSWLVEKGRAAVERYLEKIVGDFPLSYGYAGLALSFDSGMTMGNEELERYIKNWLERHPGIMSPNPHVESKTSARKSGITSIGWITLLGQAFSEKMGGLAAIEQQIANIPDVTVAPFNHQGVMIRNGDTPQLGDTAQNNYLDSYYSLGQVLLPLHVGELTAWESEFGYAYVTGFKERSSRRKWFNRFFDPKQGEEHAS